MKDILSTIKLLEGRLEDSDAVMVHWQAKYKDAALQLDLERKARQAIEKELERTQQRLREERERNVQRHKAGEFWLQMQEQIINSPLLQVEWDRFIFYLKMAIPDGINERPDSLK